MSEPCRFCKSKHYEVIDLSECHAAALRLIEDLETKNAALLAKVAELEARDSVSVLAIQSMTEKIAALESFEREAWPIVEWAAKQGVVRLFGELSLEDRLILSARALAEKGRSAGYGKESK